MGCRGLPNLKKSYRELEGVTRGYKDYKGYKVLQRSSKRLQEVKGGYKG